MWHQNLEFGLYSSIYIAVIVQVLELHSCPDIWKAYLISWVRKTYCSCELMLILCCYIIQFPCVMFCVLGVMPSVEVDTGRGWHDLSMHKECDMSRFVHSVTVSAGRLVLADIQPHVLVCYNYLVAILVMYAIVSSGVTFWIHRQCNVEKLTAICLVSS